jgi:hypothetical protein
MFSTFCDNAIFLSNRSQITNGTQFTYDAQGLNNLQNDCGDSIALFSAKNCVFGEYSKHTNAVISAKAKMLKSTTGGGGTT